MRSLGFFAVALFFIAAVGGCVSNPVYPPSWPAIAQFKKGQCPHLEGRYLNTGASSGAYCRRSSSPYYWDCDIDLSSNLLSGRTADVERGRASRWVELKQPDDDTLVIHLDDGEAPIILKKSDDQFSCGKEGLLLSDWGSLMRRKDTSDFDVVAGTAAGMFLGTGIVQTLSRSFRRLQDGSLLMEVKESGGGAIILIPAYMSRGVYVRWSKFEPADEIKVPTH